jgi:hypothetical protein
MLSLVPGIHVFFPTASKDMDSRVKPGHDGYSVRTGHAFPQGEGEEFHSFGRIFSTSASLGR